MTCFIEKYYNEFGKKCPFKCTDMGLDEKELVDQFESKLKGDIKLLEKFFKASVDEVLKENYFTSTEIERLKYLDHYWDIPKINFIYTNEFELSISNIYSCAVRYGNLRILKWLKKDKCPWGRNTITYAIEYAIEHNDLENLRWLRENGYDEYISLKKKRKKDLQCQIKYARKRELELSKKVRKIKAEKQQVKRIYCKPKSRRRWSSKRRRSK